MSYTVLIIDSSEADRKMVQGFLRHSQITIHSLTATNSVEGVKILLNHEVDLILYGTNMPGINGLELLSMLREKEEFEDIPIIILIDGQKADRKKALKAGACDYINKPFDEDELLARIDIYIKNKALKEELRLQEGRLNELSKVDSLTGVSNRSHLIEMLELELLRAERYSSPLSFIICDLDDYQPLVHMHGVPFGELVLISLSNRIREGLRVTDVFGRMDDDEFGFLLTETNLQGAMVVAERYRLLIEEVTFMNEQERVKLTASFGVVCYPHRDIGDVTDMIEKAHKALNIAKAGGRNRVVVLE